MAENEIEIPSFGVKGVSALPSDSGQVLANLASNVFDSDVVPTNEIVGGGLSSIARSDVVPTNEIVGGGLSSVESRSDVQPGDISIGEVMSVKSVDVSDAPSELPAGKSSVIPISKGSLLPKGITTSVVKDQVVNVGEPTLSQIEKVYDATNTCRGNDEIVKITGLNMSTVVACVAWLVKKGWIVTDENKRACSIEAVGRYREKFKKLCDWCNK